MAREPTSTPLRQKLLSPCAEHGHRTAVSKNGVRAEKPMQRPRSLARTPASTALYLIGAGVVQEEDHERERDGVDRGTCIHRDLSACMRVTCSPAAALRPLSPASLRVCRKVITRPRGTHARRAGPNQLVRRTQTRAGCARRSRSCSWAVPPRPGPATGPAPPCPSGSPPSSSFGEETARILREPGKEMCEDACLKDENTGQQA